MEFYFIFGILSICAWSDFKRKQISCVILWIGGIGVSIINVIQIISDNRVWWDGIGGATIGALLILLSLITNQQIGLGDGILFVITGIGLGVINNITLFLSSLCITSIISLVLLSIKKVGRKTTVPFVPSIWICFVIKIIYSYFYQ